MTATLCRYHYDPLDRLAACAPADVASIQRFYQKNRLATEIQGQIQRTVFQTEDHLLAQHDGQSGCALLASDQQRSVLLGLDATQQQAVVYAPYGARHPHADPLGLLGFTGERADPVTGHYLLGNGYRAFNPVLMRFNSPDSLSPFGEGGLNAYAYCVGDPVNRVDPTGHIFGRIRLPSSPINRVVPPRVPTANNLSTRGTSPLIPTGSERAETGSTVNRPPTPPLSSTAVSEGEQADIKALLAVHQRFDNAVTAGNKFVPIHDEYLRHETLGKGIPKELKRRYKAETKHYREVLGLIPDPPAYSTISTLPPPDYALLAIRQEFKTAK